MKVTEEVQKYIETYRIKVAELNEMLAACSQQIEDIKLEVRFIREKELPEASVKRVLEGDNILEAKLKKKLEKLEDELLEKQEEQLILANSLKKYKLQSSEELQKIQPLFNDERKVASNMAYNKMMAKKREYVETMKAEAEVLHQYQAIDIRLQEIEVDAGLRNSVYTTLNVDSAPIEGHLNRHNGVYLAIPNDDVQKIIRKQPIDLKYLDKFKHIKAL